MEGKGDTTTAVLGGDDGGSTSGDGEEDLDGMGTSITDEGAGT